MPEWQDARDVERFVLVFLKIILLFGSLFYPVKEFGDLELVCYAHKKLPGGKSVIHQHYLLDKMHWGRLPIESLWPLIRLRPELKMMLPQHCHQLEYTQLLWIAQNDPVGIRKLLSDPSCVRSLDWSELDIKDYRNYFPALNIYDFSDYLRISPDVIRTGLLGIDYFFPKTDHLARFLVLFLDTSPRSVCYFSDDIFAFDLFDIDVIMKMKEESCITGDQIKALLDLFLKLAPSRLEFEPLHATIRYQEALTAYSLKLRELAVISQTNGLFSQFPEYTELIQSLLNRFPVPNFYSCWSTHWQRYERLLITQALLNEDVEFFIRNFGLVSDYYKSSSPGSFHQRRLLDLLLSSESFTQEIRVLLADFLEAEVIEEKVIVDAMKSSEAFEAKLIEFSETNLKLLRTLSLLPRPQNLNPRPVFVPQISNLTGFVPLSQAATLILARQDAFILPSFAVKFSEDAVIDLGGPLLDWIHQMLKAMLQHLRFCDARQIGTVRPAPFLPLNWFLVLGLLHGKLLQLNCQLPWALDINFGVAESIEMAFENVSEAAAIQIFNETGFRLPDLVFEVDASFQLVGCYEEGQQVQVSNQASIKYYFAQVRESFAAWKRVALEFYQNGLGHFLRPGLSLSTLDRLLQPSRTIDLQVLKMAFKLKFESFDEAVDLFSRLRLAWNQVLDSLSGEEISQLLLFCTGQSGLMFNSLDIQIHFSISSERRLPHAKTCSRDIFIYAPSELMASPKALSACMRTSLLTAIFNYEGFGHS